MPKKVNPDVETFARIKVIGIGGSGGNVVNHMINSKVKGVDFIAINTDAQDLHHSEAKHKVHIGKNLTRGLGTGMSPELGNRAAEETKEEIQEVVKNADMVFITCGMGGGTGTGAAPVVAQVARESGALTVGVVSKPFFFEGAQRKSLAEEGLLNLQHEVDALIVIPNDRLLQTVDEETTAVEAFALCDEILREAVEGISDLITTPGIINVDFADIRSVMESAGSALMGVGVASGEERAVAAATDAINSPLLDVSIDGAEGVLFAIAGGEDLKMHEIQAAAKVITESIDANAKVIFGAIKDDSIKKNQIRVTVIATGFPEDKVLTTDDSESSIFGFGDKMKSKKVEEEEEAELIHSKLSNTLKQNRDKRGKEERKKSDQKSDKKTKDQKKNFSVKEEEEDEDDWHAIPAFLRRSKDRKKGDKNEDNK